MVFSSSIFLFLFLPVVLLLYFAAPRRLKNTMLLAASLFFYAWGETYFVLVMLASILANYVLGLLIARSRPTSHEPCAAFPAAKLWVGVAVVVNLGLLVTFKYANFMVDNLNVVLQAAGLNPLHLGPVHLPIGISFFTFQALTYVVDVYRGQAQVERNPINVSMYIALFPQLIAGPIVRYSDIARQIRKRSVSWDDFASGVGRFVVGLGKKMLIANTVAVPVDRIFSLPANELTTGMAWLGVLYYALQIYFDFSGYSDMAIGLGRMFGFRFLENFNFPYIARSMREFWQRWHISLSTWFRDYVYIPLGGNRRRAGRVYGNLVTVFLLCGLWHGASWNFLVWGLFHGAFLIIERVLPERKLSSLFTPLRLAYVWLAVLVSWVLFRSETLGYALSYLGAMAGFAEGSGFALQPHLYLNRELVAVSLCGMVGSAPVMPFLKKRIIAFLGRVHDTWASGVARTAVATAHILALAFIVLASAMKLAAGTHNPFIYFRF